jgi:hypothetical protein
VDAVGVGVDVEATGAVDEPLAIGDVLLVPLVPLVGAAVEPGSRLIATALEPTAPVVLVPLVVVPPVPAGVELEVDVFFAAAAARSEWSLLEPPLQPAAARRRRRAAARGRRFMCAPAVEW